jgi:hypothetical protein
MSLTRAALAILVCISVVSCSSIEPKRITDGNEKTAVGLRYYETRPFILVRKPYAIASTPYLVHGVLQADGKSFVVTDAPPELKLPVRTQLALAKPLPFRTSPPAAQSGAADVSPPASNAEDTDKPKTGCKSEKSADAPVDPPANGKEGVPECKDTSGARLAFSSISLETDLTGTALVPVNDLFSIIYLPDYDREFYVESKARWGMSKLHITRGPGGVLLAYNSEVDNSAVVKPLMDAWTALVDAATKAAVIKIAPKAQSGAVGQTRKVDESLDGTPATLRIHVVKYAVPGVYPLIKPAEATAKTWGNEKTDDRMLVPIYPYQVPYDYTTVLLAEHLLEPAGTTGVLNVPSVVSGAGEQGESDEAGGARNAPRPGAVCDKAEEKAPASLDLKGLKVVVSKDSLGDNVTGMTIKQRNPLQCASEIDVVLKAGSDKKSAIEARLLEAFAKTKFNVSVAP